MSRVAIITGASSGLGALFAKELDRLAGKEWDIDEFCLIARRAERLKELSQTISRPCTVLSLDLCEPSSVLSVASAMQGKTAALLINCAGFGRIGTFEDIPLLDTDNMIELNCRAQVDLTKVLLPFMSRGSTIINIASVAAFQPFGHLAIYAATKAFLLSWSRALGQEIKPRGISVTAVCPYWIRGTEFIGRALSAGKGALDDAAKSSDAVYSPSIKHFFFCDEPHAVVRAALRGARQGKTVVTTSVVSTAHRMLCKILPIKWMQWIWEGLRAL